MFSMIYLYIDQAWRSSDAEGIMPAEGGGGRLMRSEVSPATEYLRSSSHSSFCLFPFTISCYLLEQTRKNYC